LLFLDLSFQAWT